MHYYVRAYTTHLFHEALLSWTLSFFIIISVRSGNNIGSCGGATVADALTALSRLRSLKLE